MAMVMEASPSLSSDSIPRLDAGPACLECCSFNSSASFIDMDPADLFSMRWTSCPDADADESAEFDFGLPCAAAQYQYCSSPLLVGASGLLPPSASSPASFYSARSTPAAADSPRRAARAPRPLLLATRRVLQGYLRLLAPLCRKARALAASSSPRTASASPGRQSTSSYASAVEQYWCHGNADSAVRDAILYCKRSVREQDV